MWTTHALYWFRVTKSSKKQVFLHIFWVGNKNMQSLSLPLVLAKACILNPTFTWHWSKMNLRLHLCTRCTEWVWDKLILKWWSVACDYHSGKTKLFLTNYKYTTLYKNAAQELSPERVHNSNPIITQIKYKNDSLYCLFLKQENMKLL